MEKRSPNGPQRRESLHNLIKNALNLRFGVYEFDVASRELRKYGARVRLPAQPAKVLELPLSAPQQVVTRHEMKERLWPGGGFNDLDHGLNKAVNKVREALCDPAGHPVYIETIPKLGYRLLQGMKEVDRPAAGGKSLISGFTATARDETGSTKTLRHAFHWWRFPDGCSRRLAGGSSADWRLSTCLLPLPNGQRQVVAERRSFAWAIPR